MDRPVELIPLVCSKCNRPVPAEPGQVAWACEQCGQGLLLDESKGLVPLEICYAAGINPNTKGKPFWVAEGRVTLHREMYAGNSEREAQAFWSQPRRFFVPAYVTQLNSLVEAGVSLLYKQPDLQPGPAAAFEPVVLQVEDIQPAAEFIVMAVEAGRKDKLKEVNFNLQLSAPVLWILP